MNKFARDIILLVSVLLSFLPSAARELYCEPAVPISGTFRDSIPANLVSCDYHYRVELPGRSSSAEWGVRLMYGDGRTCDIALCCDNHSVGDADYAPPVDIALTCSDGAVDRVDRRRINDGIDAAMTSWSLCLLKRVEDDSLICLIGQRDALTSFSLPYEGLSEIESYAGPQIRLRRLSLFVEADSTERSCAFETVEDLNKYLAESEDDRECCWRYLDRDTDPRRLNTGGDYRLATVRRDDGGYDIIYLGGATANAANWRPLMLKGRLKPTAFISHYDLVWFDAFGRAIDTETSADLTDGAILHLNFPLQGGSIRYQRDITRDSSQTR